MRNILVHQYKDIDNWLVFAAIPKALDQYPLYVQQITAYIDSLEVMRWLQNTNSLMNSSCLYSMKKLI